MWFKQCYKVHRYCHLSDREILEKILSLQEQNMADLDQIKSQLEQVVANQTAQGTTIASMATSQNGISADVQKLLDIVNGSGTDQEKLDQIATLASGILAVSQGQTEQLNAVAAALAATDAQYPPAP